MRDEDDYLWSPAAPPDPDVVGLERVLAVLRDPPRTTVRPIATPAAAAAAPRPRRAIGWTEMAVGVIAAGLVMWWLRPAPVVPAAVSAPPCPTSPQCEPVPTPAAPLLIPVPLPVPVPAATPEPEPESESESEPSPPRPSRRKPTPRRRRSFSGDLRNPFGPSRSDDTDASSGAGDFKDPFGDRAQPRTVDPDRLLPYGTQDRRDDPPEGDPTPPPRSGELTNPFG